jgi:hypothetical protein
MQKHKIILAATFLLLVAFTVSCSSSKSTSVESAASSVPSVLTEDRAKKAVASLLAQGEALPNNTPPAKLVTWQGLVQISDKEMQGKSVIQCSKPLMGKFIFHKTADGGWAIDRVEFRSANRERYWIEDVFQKVE